MGTKAYKAFRCSALASFAGNKDEQHRLFQLGYDDGKTFIEARRNGKIEGADLSQVPTGIIVDIEGPTADFSLGRLWEGVVEDLNDRLGRSSDGIYLSEDQLATAAKDHFSSENCGFIGPDPAR